MQRDFFWRGACGLARTGGGASALRAKMGSSEFVKSDQFGKIPGTVARMGDFFFGSAERIPKGFLGGVRFGVALGDDFFVFHF